MSELENMIASFEEAGEDAVRWLVASRKYSEQKNALAIEWLRRLESEREEELAYEQLILAQRANAAAWFSSIAAAISALATLIAVIVG